MQNQNYAAETMRILQKTFGDEKVYKWYKNFKEGRESIKDADDHQHQLRNNMLMKPKILFSKSIKIFRLNKGHLVDTIGISKGSVNIILKYRLVLKMLKF